MIFFVRHAERSGGGMTMSNDDSLSPAGRERAELLARTLADAGIKRIFVSEYKRTQETAAPLARKLAIAPQSFPGADTAPLIAAIRGVASGAVLVVGHSNTLPGLVSALGGPEIPKIGEDEYDNLYVLTVFGNDVSLVRLHFGAPRPPAHVAVLGFPPRAYPAPSAR